MEAFPFIAGLVIQLLGSVLFYSSLSRLVRKEVITPRARQHLARDGDLVQLVATATAVIFSAPALLADRPLFLDVTLLVALVAFIAGYALGRDLDPGVYDKLSFFIFTPACNLAILLCGAGLLIAVLG